jgi:stage II sporulation protein D
MCIRFFGVFLLFFPLLGSGQNISIRIFSQYEFSDFSFRVESGRYEIISNGRIAMRLDTGDSVFVYSKGRRMRISGQGAPRFGAYRHLHIRGALGGNIFCLSPVADGATPRVYDDDIMVTLDSGAVTVINDVNFEKYVAAVVESEGGPTAHNEYFKCQAVLSRTYAMRYHDKHIKEGYNLCDDVHCQAYKQRCLRNRDIYAAAVETAGLVVVDDKMKLISATYYSNSGGQTANSEDVWSAAVPYLRSQADPYSKGMRNFNWTRSISIADWAAYLSRKGAKVPDGARDFQFSQPVRAVNYTYRGLNIPTKTVRADWGLRSAFFDIKVQGDNLVFEGRGYGHGVGMSQEGAMNMARQGFNYEQIIKFYYQGVNIISTRAFSFFHVEE